MYIESAKIAIDKMASFLPEWLLNDLYKDHNATAHIISKDADKLVFSVIFNNGEKRILTVTVKKSEINVHYNGTMQVFSKLITVEFFNDVLNMLHPEVKTEKECEMIVQNMTSRNGNKIPNQLVIKLPENVTIFQSYNTVIAQNRNGTIILDSNALEYSATTTKYLKQFLNTSDSKKQLQDKIKNGFYQVEDLNN